MKNSRTLIITKGDEQTNVLIDAMKKEALNTIGIPVLPHIVILASNEIIAAQNKCRVTRLREEFNKINKHRAEFKWPPLNWIEYQKFETHFCRGEAEKYRAKKNNPQYHTTTPKPISDHEKMLAATIRSFVKTLSTEDLLRLKEEIL